ncbi:MAG: hypothetical protein LBR88_11220 [Zoogloeaceae bacterium]|jgi:hypothetical protein|nr:hypothetical protein [Zoogloeaceae bacterium]
MASSSDRRVVAAICLIAIVGFVFVIHASYPGYLHADNVLQSIQIRNNEYSDWQPPFIILLWIGVMKIFPGPVGLLVLGNLLIWGALAGIALGIRRYVGRWALLALVIPFMPGILNFIGHTNRDTLLAACMLAAFACAFRATAPDIVRGKRLALQMLVAVFAVAAFLVRPNAIFALLPLLLYAYSPLGRRRNLLVSLTIAVAMPAIQSGLNRLMNAQTEHPGDSIKTYHLLALSYFEGKNLFPGVWTEAESRQIVEECYSPNQWDTAVLLLPFQCGMIHSGLKTQGLWGSDTLTRTWLAAMAKNPVGAYAAMAATFRIAMRTPNSPLILYPPDRVQGVEYFAVLPPFRATTQAAHDYMRSSFNKILGMPWVFATVLAVNMALLLVTRRAGTRIGLFALAVAGSGAIYLLTYFPFNVSAEYRYFYWSGVAGWLGMSLHVMTWRAARKEEKRALPHSLRLGACAIVAATITLVSVHFKLPMEKRTVIVTPQGEGSLTVGSLRAASTPYWMPPFDGSLSAPGWRWEGTGWHTGDTPSPLVTTVKTLHQTVRVGFQTGPDGGKARIEDNGKVTLVDTRAAKQEKMIVDLPPQGTWTQTQRQGSWHAPARAGLAFVVLTTLLYWLSGRRGRLTADVEAGGNLHTSAMP